MRKFGALLLVLGVLLGLCAGGWMIYNEREDERAGKASEEALEQLLPIILERRAGVEAGDVAVGDRGGETGKDFEMGEMDVVVDVPLETTMDVVVIDGYSYIGYLAIPEINLNLPVQADWTMERLEKSPARYAGNLAAGNLIILGHNYNRHFTPLKRVSVGAQVLFTDVNGVEYDYVVSQIVTIKGDDEEAMLSDAENWDLTLFTCTYGGKNRLALRCVLQENDP